MSGVTIQVPMMSLSQSYYGVEVSHDPRIRGVKFGLNAEGHRILNSISFFYEKLSPSDRAKNVVTGVELAVSPLTGDRTTENWVKINIPLFSLSVSQGQ